MPTIVRHHKQTSRLLQAVAHQTGPPPGKPRRITSPLKHPFVPHCKRPLSNLPAYQRALSVPSEKSAVANLNPLFTAPAVIFISILFLYFILGAGTPKPDVLDYPPEYPRAGHSSHAARSRQSRQRGVYGGRGGVGKGWEIKKERLSYLLDG